MFLSLFLCLVVRARESLRQSFRMNSSKKGRISRSGQASKHDDYSSSSSQNVENQVSPDMDIVVDEENLNK